MEEIDNDLLLTPLHKTRREARFMDSDPRASGTFKVFVKNFREFEISSHRDFQALGLPAD
jgi:hypothetical protein